MRPGREGPLQARKRWNVPRKTIIQLGLLAFVAGCTYVNPREYCVPWTEGQPVVWDGPDDANTVSFAYAIRVGDKYTVARHLEDPNNLNRPTSGGLPLYWALWSGRDEIIQLLLDRGANPNLQTPDGMPLLSYAVRNTDTKIVDMMLRHNCLTTSYDALGRSPLHHACLVDSSDIAAMLVQRGAEVNVKDFEGMSPLDLVRGVDDKIAHMLYERKALLGHPRQAPTEAAPLEAKPTAKRINEFLGYMSASEAWSKPSHIAHIERQRAGVDMLRDLLQTDSFVLSAYVLDVDYDPQQGPNVTLSLPFGIDPDIRMDFAPVLPLPQGAQQLARVHKGDIIVFRGRPYFYYGSWNKPKDATAVMRVIRDWPENESYPVRWSEAKHSYHVALSEITFDIIPRKSEKMLSELMWGTPIPVDPSVDRAKRIYPPKPPAPPTVMALPTDFKAVKAQGSTPAPGQTPTSAPAGTSETPASGPTSLPASRPMLGPISIPASVPASRPMTPISMPASIQAK